MLHLRLLKRLLTFVVVTIATVYFVAFCMTLLTSEGLVSAAAPAWELPWEELLRGAGQMALAFAAGLWRGDLGTTPVVAGEQPVMDVLWFTFFNSIALLFMALLLALTAGLLLGILAALSKSKRRLYAFLLLSSIGVAAPSFFLAVLLQNAGLYYTRTFGSRLVSMGGYMWDWKHLVLPVTVLAARPVAYIARTTYVSLLDIMREDYIRTAFAKGFSVPRTVVTHALRNLAVPLLSSSGLSLRFALSALPIVEFLFAWPGMGRRILEAINERIPMLVIALALLISVLLQLVSALLDIAYHLADPRLREE